MKKRLLLGFAVLVSSLGLSALAAAQVTPNDADGDGLSDILIVRPESAEKNKLYWRSSNSLFSFAQETGLGSLGKRGDFQIPGNWSQINPMQIGIVSFQRETADQLLIWRIRDENEALRDFLFGEKTDTIVSGGDYNGNGYFDAAIVQPLGNAVIKTDPFAPEDASSRVGVEVVLRFSASTTKRGIPLFVNRTGQRDELGFLIVEETLKKNKKRRRFRHTLETRDIDGKQHRKRFHRIPLRKITQVIPVALATGEDVLAIVSKRRKLLEIYIVDVEGNKLLSRKFRGSGAVLAGDFTAAPGEELAVQLRSSVTIFNPIDESELKINVSPGTAVDHVVVGSFVRPKEKKLKLSDVCQTVLNVPLGVLYVPSSTASGTRRGLPAALFQLSHHPNKNAVRVYASNGSELAVFGYSADGSPETEGLAEHYYSGEAPGSGTSADSLQRAAAAAAGSSNIYIEGPGTTCYGPIDPEERTGGLTSNIF